MATGRKSRRKSTSGAKQSSRRKGAKKATRASGVEKMPTGIPGLDTITGGGLPRNRITALLGGPGTCKTVLGAQILAGGVEQGEPGLFVAFEEGTDQIIVNCSAFAWGDQLAGDQIGFVDARLPEDAIAAGAFDVQGLLARVGAEARQIGARRIVLDGLDVLLDILADEGRVRQEVFRLRNWLGESGLSALLTVKADPRVSSPLSEHVQYLADCVVELEHRLVENTAVRELRISKYRGARHSANEHPFIVSSAGFELAPRGTGRLQHQVSSERVSSGIRGLDGMLGGGYYRSSSVLISGAPGTAKTTLAGTFLDAACRRGEKSLYVSFDESAEQIVRNLRSIGIDIEPHVDRGKLRIESMRTRTSPPHFYLASIIDMAEEHGARNLVIDPVSAFGHLHSEEASQDAAVELVDRVKTRGITLVGTTLLGGQGPEVEQTPIGLSTVADTWIHLSYVSRAGERNRALSIIKSRGMSHSNQVRELLLSNAGPDLAEVYTAGGEVLMGTLRWEKERESAIQRETQRREAQEREQQARLALDEVHARLKSLEQERAMRAAELERLAEDSSRRAGIDEATDAELRRMRGGEDAEASTPRRPGGKKRSGKGDRAKRSRSRGSSK
jgi:circadian clock protein KaiC